MESTNDAPKFRFWDRHAERYARARIGDEESYERKLKVTQQYLQPHMRVFEFGCGTGSTALRHAPHVAHIHATDGSPKMIEIAQGKAAEQNIENVTFERASIEGFETTERYDAVLALNILHLVDDAERSVHKAVQLLKPGGVLITSTPCLGDSLLFTLLLPPMRLIGLAPPVLRFKKQWLLDCLVRAGLSLEESWQPKPRSALFAIGRKPAS